MKKKVVWSLHPQLVNQTLEKAKAYGIPAVSYERGQSLDDDFVNGNAIMVATCKALFNGRSKFGIRDRGQPQRVSAIILDDAHVAFSVIRKSFTLEVKSNNNRTQYENLTELFRKTFKNTDRLGTFNNTISNLDYAILKIPY